MWKITVTRPNNPTVMYEETHSVEQGELALLYTVENLVARTVYASIYRDFVVTCKEIK